MSEETIKQRHGAHAETTDAPAAQAAARPAGRRVARPSHRSIHASFGADGAAATAINFGDADCDPLYPCGHGLTY